MWSKNIISTVIIFIHSQFLILILHLYYLQSLPLSFHTVRTENYLAFFASGSHLSLHVPTATASARILQVNEKLPLLIFAFLIVVFEVALRANSKLAFFTNHSDITFLTAVVAVSWIVLALYCKVTGRTNALKDFFVPLYLTFADGCSTNGALMFVLVVGFQANITDVVEVVANPNLWPCHCRVTLLADAATFIIDSERQTLHPRIGSIDFIWLCLYELSQKNAFIYEIILSESPL